MATAAAVSVTCHECGHAVPTALPHRVVAASAEEGERLKGVEVTCERCGTSFDCYYY